MVQRSANAAILPVASSSSIVTKLSALGSAGCRLVEAIQPAIRKAASHLLAQIAESYFMPFCLAATAALARINVRLPASSFVLQHRLPSGDSSSAA